MILTVDIGNTNIKVGAWDNDDLVFVSRLQTNALRTGDEYAINLLDIFRLNDCNNSQFDGAIISSVVPPLSLPFKTAVQTVLQTRRVYLVSPGLKTGLNIKIDDPATLGGDIVSAGVAALARYPMPCIIVGMGTATVLFALNREGEYLGGAIAPGVILALDALASGTAQLPQIGLEGPGPVIGTNTSDSMKSGSIYGTACMLDGMIGRIRDELGGEAFVVAFGGVAPAIVAHCREKIEINDDLVLEGLKLIYHRNARGRGGNQNGRPAE